jgi:hypothetical protein
MPIKIARRPGARKIGIKMRKNRLTIILLLSILLYSCSEKSKNEKMILGIWDSNWPVNDNYIGYIFFPNNQYIFCRDGEVNNSDVFYACTGRWRIINNIISINIKWNYYFENVVTRLEVSNSIDPKNKLVARKGDDSWIDIGSIDDYEDRINRYYENSKKSDDDRSDIYPGIILKKIMNGKVYQDHIFYQYSEDPKKGDTIYIMQKLILAKKLH